jgi:hypothetical protein
MLESIEAAKARQCQTAAADESSSTPLDLDALAKRLRDIGLSDDTAVLTGMSVKMRRDGIMALEDLRGLTKDDLQKELSALNLGKVQLNKLFDAVSKL